MRLRWRREPKSSALSTDAPTMELPVVRAPLAIAAYAEPLPPDLIEGGAAAPAGDNADTPAPVPPVVETGSPTPDASGKMARGTASPSPSATPSTSSKASPAQSPTPSRSASSSSPPVIPVTTYQAEAIPPDTIGGGSRV